MFTSYVLLAIFVTIFAVTSADNTNRATYYALFQQQSTTRPPNGPQMSELMMFECEIQDFPFQRRFCEYPMSTRYQAEGRFDSFALAPSKEFLVISYSHLTEIKGDDSRLYILATQKGRPDPTASLELLIMDPTTTNEVQHDPWISPDNNLVAYTYAEDETKNTAKLAIFNIKTGKSTKLRPPGDEGYGYPMFTPNGQQIIFYRTNGVGGRFEICMSVPTLAGVSKPTCFPKLFPTGFTASFEHRAQFVNSTHLMIMTEKSYKVMELALIELVTDPTAKMVTNLLWHPFLIGDCPLTNSSCVEELNDIQRGCAAHPLTDGWDQEPFLCINRDGAHEFFRRNADGHQDCSQHAPGCT